MYLLDLIKYSVFSIDNKRPGEYIVLGGYDRLTVRTVTSFNQIFNSNSAQEIIELDGYTKRTVALFNIVPAGNCTQRDLLCEIIDNKDRTAFYSICSLKLGFALFGCKGYEEKTENCKYLGKGTRFFIYVAGIIADVLEKMKKEQGMEDLEYQITGNLGAFDLTVITKHSAIPSLLCVPEKLKQLSCEETNTPLFAYSTTLIAFHHMFNVKEMKFPEIKCNVYVLRAPYEAGLTFEDKGKIHFDSVEPLIDDNYYMLPLDIKQIDLVQYFMKDKSENPSNIGNKPYAKFRSTKTILVNDEDANEKRTAALDAMVEQNDKISPIITDLKACYKEAFLKLPPLLRHNLNNCMAICINLLQNDLSFITGKKIADILFAAMSRIREAETESYGNAKDSFFHAASRCLQDILMILPSIKQADMYILHNDENSDPIGPLAKLYFAVEQLITRLFEDLDVELLTPEKKYIKYTYNLFLTVGKANNFSSVHYFNVYFISNTQQQRKLLSFNLPNAAHLPMSAVLPFSMHEAGHYLILESSKKNRNNCLYGMFKKYLISFIGGYVVVEDISQLRGITQSFTRKIDEFFKDSKYSFTEIMTSSECENAWLNGVSEFFRIYYPKFDERIVLALKDGDYTNAIITALLESYSDYIMVFYGSYTVVNYVLILYSYFSSRDMYPEDDFTIHIRLSALFGYYYYIETKELEPDGFGKWLDLLIRDLPRKQAQFMHRFSNEIKKHLLFVEPIIVYLLNLKPNKKLTFDGCMPCDFLIDPQDEGACKADIQLETNSYIDLWFEFIRKMEAKAWK